MIAIRCLRRDRPRSHSDLQLAFPQDGRDLSPCRQPSANSLLLSAISAFRSLLSPQPYSHSIVAGGFDDTSYTTRLIPFTWLLMRDEIRARTSCGNGNQSAVIPSVLVTARKPS